MTIIDTYEALYGLREKVLLRTLGGDPNAIIAEITARVTEPNPLADMLGVAPATDAEIAEAAHHAIQAAIQTAYFGQMDRTTAVAVAAALSAVETATLSICDGMTYNDYSFVAAWASAHPDEDRISLIDPDCLP